MIRDGNIEGIPHTVSDVKAFYDIWGPPIERLRGTMTNKKVGSDTNFDAGLLEQRKVQVMIADTMYWMRRWYLASIMKPLNLMVVVPTGATEEMQARAVQAHINLLENRGFLVRMVVVDPERALAALRGKIPGVHIDVLGAGDKMLEVDIHIRRLKEMCRSTLCGLQYTLLRTRVDDLVMYAVNRKNIRRTKGLNDNVCPRVKFTGRKINYKLDFSVSFGDYCEVKSFR